MKTITEVRASGLSRIMTCPGSLFFENLPEQETHEAAKEGTACGEYLERLLLNKDLPSHAANGVAFNDDMRFYTNSIAEDITARAASPVLCETEVDWISKSGIKVGAHYDVAYVNHEGKLCIDDLKYGWNLVEVKENWQLLAYAIGEVMRRGQMFERIIMRIMQPRPHHEDGQMREWEITYEQLLEYKEKIEVRLAQIATGYAELVTSQKCKYCPAAASACTAFNRSVFHGIDYVLINHQQDNINDKEVSFQLDLLGRVNEVLKIKTDSLKQLAVDRIKNGAIIPNYITEQSFGDRKWKSDVSPKAIEMLTGINIVKEQILSPAQAEKVGVSKDLVKTYVDRHFIGNKLVRKDANKIADAIFNKPKGELT